MNPEASPALLGGSDPSESASMARLYGACGVEGCDECFPLFSDADEPITDNSGRPL